MGAKGKDSSFVPGKPPHHHQTIAMTFRGKKDVWNPPLIGPENQDWGSLCLVYGPVELPISFEVCSRYLIVWLYQEHKVIILVIIQRRPQYVGLCFLGVFTRGPKRPHKHKDPTFWFQGPRQGEFQKPWGLVGSLSLPTMYYIPYIFHVLCTIYYVLLHLLSTVYYALSIIYYIICNFSCILSILY